MVSKQSYLFDFDQEPMNKRAIPPAKEVSERVTDNIKSATDPFIINDIEEQVPVIKKSTRGRKKLSEAALTADLIEVPEDEILFQKKYYSIGLVAEMFKVNISLIRFWENEFDILKPKKNGKGDRHFRPEDIKNLKIIHHLLREKKYTIEGARDFLKDHKSAEENFAVIEQLRKTKTFLNELKLSL